MPTFGAFRALALRTPYSFARLHESTAGGGVGHRSVLRHNAMDAFCAHASIFAKPDGATAVGILLRMAAAPTPDRLLSVTGTSTQVMGPSPDATITLRTNFRYAPLVDTKERPITTMTHLTWTAVASEGPRMDGNPPLQLT